MNRIYLLTTVIATLVLTACGEKKEEKSNEKRPVKIAPEVPSGAGSQTMPPAQAPSIHWHIPSGWKKESASDGITAMSYASGNARLTITPLQGAAGGIEANVQRWRQQSSLPPFTPEELKSAITQLQTASGPAHIVKVATSSDAPKQIFGAILPHQGQTWFVKMTGPFAELGDAKWQEFQNLLKAAHPGGSH